MAVGTPTDSQVAHHPSAGQSSRPSVRANPENESTKFLEDVVAEFKDSVAKIARLKTDLKKTAAYDDLVKKTESRINHAKLTLPFTIDDISGNLNGSSFQLKLSSVLDRIDVSVHEASDGPGRVRGPYSLGELVWPLSDKEALAVNPGDICEITGTAILVARSGAIIPVWQDRRSYGFAGRLRSTRP